MNLHNGFYIGVMFVAAVINGIQYGSSKGYPLGRAINIFQIITYGSVVFAFFITRAQSSAFLFFSTAGFFLCAFGEIIGTTLVLSGKVKIETQKSLPNAGGKPPDSPKKGFLGKASRIKENFQTENASLFSFVGVLISLLLSLGIAFTSLMFVTGYFFQ